MNALQKYIRGFKTDVSSKAEKFSSSIHRDILLGNIDSSHKVAFPSDHYNPRMQTQSDKYMFIVQLLLHVFYNPKRFGLSCLIQRREVIRHLVLRNLAKRSYHSEDGTESIDSDEENENEAKVPFEEGGLETIQLNDVDTSF